MSLQMPALLNRTYFLDIAKTKSITVFLDAFLTPQVNITSSTDHVVLNPTAWFTLVSFKNGIPNNTVYYLGDNRHFIQKYYNRHIQIKCNNGHVLLSHVQWKNLIYLSNLCINSQILTLFESHQQLVQWRDNCLQTQSFYAPPPINGIDFQLLYNTFTPKTFIPVPCYVNVLHF